MLSVWRFPRRVKGRRRDELDLSLLRVRFIRSLSSCRKGLFQAGGFHHPERRFLLRAGYFLPEADIFPTAPLHFTDEIPDLSIRVRDGVLITPGMAFITVALLQQPDLQIRAADVSIRVEKDAPWIVKVG